LSDIPRKITGAGFGFLAPTAEFSSDFEVDAILALFLKWSFFEQSAAQ
jgi:hypothetical protein